jgi:hypothetical protein
MKVFDKVFDVKLKEDGSITISILISDNTLIIKSISRQQAEKLFSDLDVILRD